jgi:hypothetical protein
MKEQQSCLAAAVGLAESGSTFTVPLTIGNAGEAAASYLQQFESASVSTFGDVLAFASRTFDLVGIFVGLYKAYESC